MTLLTSLSIVLTIAHEGAIFQSGTFELTLSGSLEYGTASLRLFTLPLIGR